MNKKDWDAVLKAYIKCQDIDFYDKEVDMWVTRDVNEITSFDFEHDECRVTPKPRSKKVFLESTNSKLTDAECEEWMKIAKSTNFSYVQNWKYLMGRIGNVNHVLHKYDSNGNAKEISFDKRPDWRPLGHYNFTVRGWANDWVKVEGYIQSWEELLNISAEESLNIVLWKHPHQ